MNLPVGTLISRFGLNHLRYMHGAERSYHHEGKKGDGISTTWYIHSFAVDFVLRIVPVTAVVGFLNKDGWCMKSTLDRLLGA